MNPVSSTSTVVFPEELKTWLQSNGANQELLLNTVVNETVRNQFKTWASEHTLTVSKSTLLQRIVQAVSEYDKTPTEEKFTIEAFTTIEKIRQHLLFIQEYFELGLIAEEQMVQLLSTRDEKECFIHNSENFEKALPILDKLSHFHLICLFSITDAHGNTPIHAYENFSKFLPILTKRPVSEIIDILAIQNEAGVPVLFTKETLAAVLRLLITAKEILDVVSIRDKNNKTAFHYPDNFSILEKIPLTLLIALLLKIFTISETSNQDTFKETLKETLAVIQKHLPTLLDGYKSDPNNTFSPHDSPMDKQFFEFLKKMPLSLAIALVSSLDNYGNSVLHYKENFTQFLRTFPTLSLPEFKEICGIEDRFGNLVQHNPETFSAALAHLITELQCQSNDLITFLSFKDSMGRTPLHQRANFQAFSPFLEKFTLPLLIKIISILDSSGTPVLHTPGVFSVLMPHIEKLTAQKKCSPKQFQEILLIADAQGRILLHNSDNFAIFLTFFKELQFDLLLSLLKIQDKSGMPVLHSQNNFVYVMPHILSLIDKDQCTPMQFESLLSLRNASGHTFFDNKETGQDLKDVLSVLGQRHVSIFENEKLFPTVLSFMVTTLKYPPGHVCEVLAYRLVGASNFKEFLPYLKTIPFANQLNFFETNSSILHSYKHFSLAVPFFLDELKYAPEQLRILLSSSLFDDKTPLYDIINFQFILPYIKKFSFYQQILFFSTISRDRLTVIHMEDIFEHLFPFLIHELKYTHEQLLTALSITGQLGEDDDSDDDDDDDVVLVTPLAFAKNFELVLTYLSTIPYDQQIKFFSLNAKSPFKVIHIENYFKMAVEFIENSLTYTSQQLFELLSILDERGNTPLHYDNNFSIFLPFLKTIPVDDHLKFFSLQGAQQKLVLFQPTNLMHLLPFLLNELHYTPEQLLTVLSIKDKDGKFPLNYPILFQKFLTVLPFLSFEDVLQIFSLQNDHKNPVLFYGFDMALPYLNSLSTDNIKKVFEIKGGAGNSLFHIKHIRSSARSLIEKYHINLNEYVNLTTKLSAADLHMTTLSPSWLTRPKTAEFLRKEITREEYDKRVENLQLQLETLWKEPESCFEAGSLSQAVFYTNSRQYLPGDIKTSLLEMILLMKNQTAWLGTPKEEETELLHRFYCSQLFDFEVVLSELEKKNSAPATAGHLTDIASVRFQGRCASGYQAEIEQKRTSLMGKVQGINEIIMHGATSCLRVFIDRLIARRYGGDVHAINQFYFAANLAEHPDPLPPQNLTLETAQQLLIQEFDPLYFYNDFRQHMTSELAFDWLQLHTPEDFGPKFQQLHGSIKEDEEAILHEFKAACRQCLSKEQGDTLFDALLETKAPFFVTSNLKNAEKGTLLGQLFTRYPFVTSSDAKALSLEEIKESIEEDIRGYKKTFERNDTYNQRLRDLHSAKTALFEELEALFKFLELMETHQVPSIKRLFLLKAMLVFQSALDILGDDILSGQGISYVPSTHLLPSRAVEYARRRTWSQSIIDQQFKMLEHVLLHIGVIEKKT